MSSFRCVAISVSSVIGLLRSTARARFLTAFSISWITTVNVRPAPAAAATQTTGAITDLVKEFCGGKSEEWQECAYLVCAALALAERGTRLLKESQDHAVKALFDALNPILTDRLDHQTLSSDSDLESVGKGLLEHAKKESDQWKRAAKSGD